MVATNKKSKEDPFMSALIIELVNEITENQQLAKQASY